MARRVKSILLFCLAILLIVGTSASVPKLIRPIGMPEIGFPTNQLKADFGMRLVRPTAFHSGLQQVVVITTIRHDDVIEFGPVQARAFLYEQGNWAEIKNLSLNSSFDILDMLHIGFSELTINLPETQNTALVRIFFFTTVTKVYTDTDEITMNKKSVSYIDVYLQP